MARLVPILSCQPDTLRELKSTRPHAVEPAARFAEAIYLPILPTVPVIRHTISTWIFPRCLVPRTPSNEMDEWNVAMVDSRRCEACHSNRH